MPDHKHYVKDATKNDSISNFESIKIGAKLTWLFAKPGSMFGVTLLAGLTTFIIYSFGMALGLALAEFIYTDDHRFTLPIITFIILIMITWATNKFMTLVWQSIAITMIQQYSLGQPMSFLRAWAKVVRKLSSLWKWFSFSLRWGFFSYTISQSTSGYLTELGSIGWRRGTALAFSATVFDNLDPKSAMRKAYELFSSHSDTILKGNIISSFYGFLIFGAVPALIVGEGIGSLFPQEFMSTTLAFAAALAYVIWFANIRRTIDLAFYALFYLYATRNRQLSTDLLEPVK